MRVWSRLWYLNDKRQIQKEFLVNVAIGLALGMTCSIYFIKPLVIHMYTYFPLMAFLIADFHCNDVWVWRGME